MRTLILAALAPLALAACAGPAPEVPEAKPARVWPDAPQPARVRFERAITGPEDLGIRKGVLAWVGELIFGAEQSRLIRPMSVVVSGRTLFVADPGARGVHRLDPEGGGYSLIPGPGGEPLQSPVGLALGQDGEVYVSDSALAGVFVIPPGAEEAVPLPLSRPVAQPTGIVFDRRAGELYVADTARDVIDVFGRDGQWRRELGGRGNEPGHFNRPTLLWLDAAGALYVSDALNFRVQVLAADGQMRRQFGRHGDGTGNMSRQKGVATDRHGHVYVVDSLFSTVQIFDRSGRYLLSVGELGQGVGQFWLPSGIFIDGDDVIYVADAFNARIQVFRYVGDAS